MNERLFKDPWLKKEYILNVQTLYNSWGFPLYAWETLEVAQRARERYSNLFIFECSAHKYYGDRIYNVSKDYTLSLLKNMYYKDQFLEKIDARFLDMHMILCTAITPLRCVG